MTVTNPNATISAVNGTAANVPAQLQCLSLNEIGRQASFGVNVDHRLYFGAAPAFAVAATLVIDGESYQVVQVRPAFHRLGEALVRKL